MILPDRGGRIVKREGNNPKRRIAPADLLDSAARIVLANKIKYIASGHHKRNPADYGLERTNPRPTKSLCDKIRIIPLKEANHLIRKGISFGMISSYAFDGFPKFVWCVGDDGEVYEAKTEPVTPGVYHGYRLEEEDDMRDLVKGVWNERCQVAGR